MLLYNCEAVSSQTTFACALQEKMWFKFLVVQVLVLHTLARDTRYVKPDNSSAVICPGQPCLTLGEFTEMADRYFTTGSTFVFSSGNHSLQTVLSLANLFDITLRGDVNKSPASIFLGRNASIILCHNVGNFHVEGITFIHKEFALQFLNSRHIMISNTIFQGTNREDTLASIASQYSSITVLNCLFETESVISTAIKAYKESIITITGSTFTKMRASVNGGAIYVRSI